MYAGFKSTLVSASTHYSIYAVKGDGNNYLFDQEVLLTHQEDIKGEVVNLNLVQL